jgi:hypothetical protein
MRTLLLLAACFLFLAMGNAAPAIAGRPVSPSRYGEWIKVNHNGVITYRYVYRGYRAGFPPPALYFYGYPRNGYSYGTGIDQTY